MKNLIIVSSIAPGIPSKLTNRIVKKLRPIWKLKKLPIKLITKMIKAPNIELSKSLNIAFNGTMKILQSTNMIQRPER